MSIGATIDPGARFERSTGGEDAPPFDRDYWLAHCTGFRVDAVEGRLGFVEDVQEPFRGGGEPTLVVRAGRLGRRLLVVPGSEVAFIVPRAQRLWLRSPTTLTDSFAAATAAR